MNNECLRVRYGYRVSEPDIRTKCTLLPFVLETGVLMEVRGWTRKYRSSALEGHVFSKMGNTRKDRKNDAPFWKEDH